MYMKNKILIIILLFCFFCGYTQVFVTKSEAIAVATKYMQHYFEDKTFQIEDVSYVSDLKKNGYVILYEVCFKNGCSTLISGVKSVKPILGYNINGDNIAFLQSNKINGLSFFVEKFASCVEKSINLKNNTILDEWNVLLYDTLSHSRNRNIYGPLITSLWKQNYSNDMQRNAYNYYVPIICDSLNNCSAGCVAVAMAQIMKYWNYPVYMLNKPEQYDWCNMPDKLLYQNGTNSNYEIERNSIARLITDCGQAAGITYCINDCESFAWPTNAKNALVNTFGYHSNANLIRRIWHLQTWKDTIKSNIIAGRPVFYAAMDEVIQLEGHAFVCDGYNSETDLFHFNWGWGGNGSWVTIDSINSGSDDWTKLERAIVNLYPSSPQDYCDFELPLWVHYYGYYNISGNSTPLPYQNVPKTFTRLVSVPDTLNFPASWRTIPNGASAEYVAHEEIVLQNGFLAEEGSDFHAHIVPCPSCSGISAQSMATGNTLSPMNDTYMPSQQDSSGTSLSESQVEQRLQVWPNPVSGTLHIQLPDAEKEVVGISVCDLLGRVILQKENFSTKTELDVSALSRGMYIIQVRTLEGNNMTAKFAKE